MLFGLLIRKAMQDDIRAILTRERFVFSEEDVSRLSAGNEKGTRYGNAVLAREEDGAKISRFVKIVLDGRFRTYRLFRRQVKMTDALHRDKNYSFPTLAFMRYSLMPPVPYAIFETRDEGDGYGFMHDTTEYYERMGSAGTEQLMDLMLAFHAAGGTLDPATVRIARAVSSRTKWYERELAELLDTRITHVTREGVKKTERVETLLALYTGMPDVRDRIMGVLREHFALVEATRDSGRTFLVHADMQIDNVYRHADGSFELLDFEWVGRTDNPIIPIMFDYGNLRARAWSSPDFQKKLDMALAEAGEKRHMDERIVRSGRALGILRSSVLMGRFHLDYENTVKKDRRSEDDYHAMYPKTVAVLKELLLER